MRTVLGGAAKPQARRSLLRMAAHSNALALEKSPYLLQHAQNPVAWLPWGAEAFTKAAQEDKPLFLSVGYSTCHWCHVMEHESFESPAVAALLNAHFVPVKVDREERPDVDKLYMSYIQATGQGGGWPMSVFLTPDRLPFLGGTYWPREDVGSRKGFLSILTAVADAWASRRPELVADAQSTFTQLAAALTESGGPASLDSKSALGLAAAQLASRYDSAHAGFGAAPKFPRPAELDALLLVAALGGCPQLGAAEALEMATATLLAMGGGGMHDALGGGFCRYSCDELWHVPHFEKMLYDNGQLGVTFADAAVAARAAGDDARAAQLAAGCRDVLDYLRRSLTRPEGGLCSAQDADSIDPATGRLKEGAFYTWWFDDVMAVLGASSPAAALAAAYYDVRPSGNCVHSRRSDPHREFEGVNVLRSAHPGKSPAEVALLAGLPPAEASATLAAARLALFQARAARPVPRLDDTVICAWNGMAISAFARASRRLAAWPPSASFPVDGVPLSVYAAAAAAVASFLRASVYDETTATLARSWRGSPSAAAGFADDYAFLVVGLLDLYEAQGDLAHLAWALQLFETLNAKFWDVEHGGWFGAAAGADAALLLRLKEDYDGAEPSASSRGVRAAFRLASLLGHDGSGPVETDFLARGRAAVAAFGQRLSSQPLALPALAAAAALDSPDAEAQLLVLGVRGSEVYESLVDAAYSVPAPRLVVAHVDLSDDACVSFWALHNPALLAQARAAGEGPLAVLCAAGACRPAVRTGDALAAQLRGLGQAAVPSRMVWPQG